MSLLCAQVVMSSGYCDPSCEDFVSPTEAVLMCSMRVNPEAPLRLTTQSAVTKIRGKRPRGARNVPGRRICRAITHIYITHIWMINTQIYISHTNERAIHIWMSHITHTWMINTHIYISITHIYISHTYEWLTHKYIYHTHMNAPYKYEWVISHTHEWFT